MRLGLALPHYDTSFGGRPVSWDATIRMARLAESVGFSSVWVSDHLFLDWSKYGGPSTLQGSLECWTTLSAIAALTERVRVGSLTLCNDLRNPALLAKMAATLDLLSGGRLDVGLGAGWYEPEFRAAGIDFDPARTRIERLGESAEILGRLLDGEELVYKGKHYTIDGAICRPLGVQQPRPPIWIGGKGDRLLSVVAKLADGWNFSWIGDLDTYRGRVRSADQACEKAGRDPATLRRSVGAFVVAGRDEADVRRRFERLAQHTPEGILRSPDGVASGGAVSWEQFRSRGLIGTTAQVVDAVGTLSGLGVEEVVVGAGVMPFQVADEEDVELIGSEIAAAL